MAGRRWGWNYWNSKWSDECFCCGSTGHQKHECPHQGKKCELCGKFGHIKFACDEYDEDDKDKCGKGGGDVWQGGQPWASSQAPWARGRRREEEEHDSPYDSEGEWEPCDEEDEEPADVPAPRAKKRAHRARRGCSQDPSESEEPQPKKKQTEAKARGSKDSRARQPRQKGAEKQGTRASSPSPASVPDWDPEGKESSPDPRSSESGAGTDYIDDEEL